MFGTPIVGVGVAVGTGVFVGVKVGPAAARPPAAATFGWMKLLLQSENLFCSEASMDGFMMNVPGVLAHADPAWLSCGAPKLCPISWASIRVSRLTALVKS